MSDRPGIPPEFDSRFQGLRVSANSFVPSVHAQPFNPFGPGGGGQQMYAPGGYAPGAPMRPPDMYGIPPHMMMQAQQMHHQSYQQQHMPRYHHPDPAAAHGYSSHPSHHMRGGAVPDHNLQGGYNQKPSPHQSYSSSTSSSSSSYMAPHDSGRAVPNSSQNRAPETHTVEARQPAPPQPEVDSWEDIATDQPPAKPETRSTQQEQPQTQSATEPKPSRKEASESSSKEHETHSSSHRHRGNGSHDSSSTHERGSKSKEPKSVAMAPKKSEDEKENVNIVFIGHVDAGKSTIGGHIMYLTGQVDKRTLEKYEREAKEKNRETWYLSWALDTNQEERDKGKTVEVGRASFETSKKRFTILDAPGHAGFVPNMISGTVQADIGVLVISARRGEFETGFERKGQTREHAMLAKTAGVKHLVVLVNKMDDPTVRWAEERYEECKMKLTPFLKKVGFNPKTDLYYIPVSGLVGTNLKEPAPEGTCPWFKGEAFIPYLDSLPAIVRSDEGPFCMPISDKYKDMGIVVLGKIESGGVCKGSSLTLMPNRTPVEVLTVFRVEEEVPAAYSGDNVKLKLKGVEEEDISSGFVLCSPHSPCRVGRKFDAQIAILEYKSIICAGFGAVLHIHSVVEEVEVVQLLCLIDRKTGKKVANKPKFVKQDQVVIARLQTSGVICMEEFDKFPSMARFNLRDEGKTIAIGKVLKILE